MDILGTAGFVILKRKKNGKKAPAGGGKKVLLRMSLMFWLHVFVQTESSAGPDLNERKRTTFEMEPKIILANIARHLFFCTKN